VALVLQDSDADQDLAPHPKAKTEAYGGRHDKSDFGSGYDGDVANPA
jgi:hypothetical protein